MPHPISSTHVASHKQETPARSIRQANQSSPTRVITRNIGNWQTTMKPKIVSFWLLFAIAPNDRIKKQLRMPPLSIRTAQALSATQTIRPSRKNSCSAPPLRTRIRKVILLVKQLINHEHAHLYFVINQKITAKTKDTRKIQYNQCHHQYHTQ